jgi:hypothetical protein
LVGLGWFGWFGWFGCVIRMDRFLGNLAAGRKAKGPRILEKDLRPWGF